MQIRCFPKIIPFRQCRLAGCRYIGSDKAQSFDIRRHEQSAEIDIYGVRFIEEEIPPDARTDLTLQGSVGRYMLIVPDAEIEARPFGRMVFRLRKRAEIRSRKVCYDLRAGIAETIPRGEIFRTCRSTEIKAAFELQFTRYTHIIR